MTLENVRLQFRLGDTWVSPAWAVLVDDAPVNLAQNGWVVRCQARRTPERPPIREWSTENGHILLGMASVDFGNTGLVGETSTIQLQHSASESNDWDPFVSLFEIEIERGSGDNVERHTVVSGRMYAMQDVTER